jgi:glycosyltransferase involved in cell wall biosynthesis
MNDEQKNFVSVIIPVFNDSDRLNLCLQALERQTYPKHLYEAIVVDNDSDANQKTETIVKQFSQTSLAFENHPSSYAARNKGISLAKGEIIAFTDSDCIPADDWLERGVANLINTHNCSVVGGKVEFFCQNPDRPNTIELYESLMAIPQQYFVEIDRFAATANLFTYKSVLDRVGYFNDRLKSSGDREWGMRVSSSGDRIIYAEDTRVAHPARYSYRQLHQKIVRLAGGFYDLGKLTMKRHYRLSELIQDLSQELKPPLTTIYYILAGKQLWFWQKQKICSIWQRWQLVFVLFLVKFDCAWEKVKLYLGNSSKRV